MAGKGISIFGDSISTLKDYNPQGWRGFYETEAHVEGVTVYEDTWWGQLIERLGGHLVSNASFSGAVMEGYGFPAGNSDQRIERLVGEDGELPEIVIIFMGINDYGWGGGRNQVMGRSLSASAKPEDLEGPKEVAGVVGPEALERFEAAYAQTINKIKALVPGVEVWCVNLMPGTVPGADWPNFIYSIRGIEFDEYNKAIARATQATGARLLDLRAFGISYDAIDGVHPTAKGMRQTSAMITACLEGVEPVAANIPEIADAPQAVRGCFEHDCDGCEYADIQPQRWSLYCTKFDPK